MIDGLGTDLYYTNMQHYSILQYMHVSVTDSIVGFGANPATVTVVVVVVVSALFLLCSICPDPCIQHPTTSKQKT